MTSPANIESEVSEQKHSSRSKTTFFDRDEVEAFHFGESRATSPAIVPDSVELDYFENTLAGRLVTRILLNQGPDGFSLVESDVAPGRGPHAISTTSIRSYLSWKAQ